ncbi:hypothetical protein ACJMK2_036428 [Sinanodonta woodiana]|uniref:Uncharacterized protein n=1 Tax=Sinanodonta woodiana TaxID=1069815 RepID=A0ABD3WKN3_SINWO
MADEKGIQGQLSEDLGLFRESDKDNVEAEEACILSEQLDMELHKLQEMVSCLENLERELDIAQHSEQTTISVPRWIDSSAVQKVMQLTTFFIVLPQTYYREFESLKKRKLISAF